MGVINAMYFHAWSSRRAGGRGIPAGDPPPFTAPAWFPPAEISSAGAALKTCPRQVFFTLRQSKENRRGGKIPRLGCFAGIRGSCEAVRRASMVPPSLRRSPAIEGPRPRITTAAGRRGAKSHLSPASRSAPSAAPGAAPAGTGVRRCRGFRSAVGADSISARRRALRQHQVSGSGKRRWSIR